MKTNFIRVVLLTLWWGGRETASLSEFCRLHANSTDARKLLLLNRISLLNGQKFVVTEGRYSYAVAVCGKVGADSNAAVLRTKLPSLPNNTHSDVLGRYNDTDIVAIDKWVMLTYASGDKIVDNGTCSGTSWKTLLFMTCGQVSDDMNLEILSESLVGCYVMFLLRSNLLCPEPKPLGKATVLFALVVIGLICYLVIGVAYRRLIAGAKGLEQIPNYDFWRNLLLMPLKLMRRREMGEGRRSEAPDEPLLSP